LEELTLYIEKGMKTGSEIVKYKNNIKIHLFYYIFYKEI
jgi:hypothetical protein